MNLLTHDDIRDMLAETIDGGKLGPIPAYREFKRQHIEVLLAEIDRLSEELKHYLEFKVS